MPHQYLNRALSIGIVILLTCFACLIIHDKAWAADEPIVSPHSVVEQKMPPSGVFRITYIPYGDDISSRPLNRKLVTLIPQLAEKDAALFIESTANDAFRIKSLNTNQYFDAPLNPASTAESNIEYNRLYKEQTGQWIFSWDTQIKAWRIHSKAWGSKAYLHTIGGGVSGFDYYCILNQSNKNEPQDAHLWRLTEILLNGTATITGDTKPGSTLTCTADITSYKPGKKGYRWYVSDDSHKKGELFKNIPPGTSLTNSLVIPESYAGRYITCEVYSDTYRGEIISNTVLVKGDNITANATIKGSYEYGSAEGLLCEVTGLPKDYVPAYTWYKGANPGDCSTEIGTGDKHPIGKDDVDSYISCKVTDSSGKYPDTFIAQGDKAFARISITAPLVIEGRIGGDGAFTIPPLSVTNESACTVSLYRINTTRSNASPLSCTLSARDTLFFKGAFGGNISLEPHIVLKAHETLPFELTIGGSLSDSDRDRLTTHGSFNLGSLTFCAKL